jgi:hypothetical protein
VAAPELAERRADLDREQGVRAAAHRHQDPRRRVRAAQSAGVRTDEQQVGGRVRDEVAQHRAQRARAPAAQTRPLDHDGVRAVLVDRLAHPERRAVRDPDQDAEPRPLPRQQRLVRRRDPAQQLALALRDLPAQTPDPGGRDLDEPQHLALAARLPGQRVTDLDQRAGGLCPQDRDEHVPALAREGHL